MIEPATFEIHRSGRIDVMLGRHLVATIYPYQGGARYRVMLPGRDGARLVSSVGKARRLVLHMLADWMEAAGPLFAQAAETLASQAELEREAA